MSNFWTRMVPVIVLFAAAAVTQGCKGPEQGGKYRITIDVCGDGTLFLDGGRIESGNLRENLQLHTQRVPKERVRGTEVSLLEVLIRTEFDVCYESVQAVLDDCGIVGIRRTCFSNPEVNSGNEIKLYSPVYGSDSGWRILAERMVEKPIIILEEEALGTEETQPKEEEKDKQEGAQPEESDCTPPITLQTVFVKLIRVNRENPDKPIAAAHDPEGNPGMTAVRVRNRLLVKGDGPDWEGLVKLLKRASRNYCPTKHFKTLPVVIQSRMNVPFADALRCVLTCRRAGISDIVFAAPEIPY